MAIKAIARMVQSILYSHRFFPYYTYVILGGIDETDGKRLPIKSVQAFNSFRISHDERSR